jgi:hypothetical protein
MIYKEDSYGGHVLPGLYMLLESKKPWIGITSSIPMTYKQHKHT